MPDAAATPLSLRECAEALGVHYMTWYRYVRMGILPAQKTGAEWRVDAADLDAMRSRQSIPAARGSAPWADRLKVRLVAGDESGAWQVVEAALASGLEPSDIYLDLIGPALRSVGDEWAHGESTIAREHRATAIATRLVGRLGRRFHMRGRPKGRIVVGTPPGERHALAVSMVADLIRGAGFEVVDLGADLPVESFVEAVVDAAPLSAVVVSVTNSASTAAAARLIAAVRDATGVPIVVGGGALTGGGQAERLVADAWAPDAPSAVAFLVGVAGRLAS
jgi:excisionase family DNA binding protein